MKKRSRLAALFSYIRGYKKFLALSFLLLAAELLISFISPLFVSVTIDNVLDGKPLNVAWYFRWFIDLAGGIEVIRKNIWIMALGIFGLQLVLGLIRLSRTRLAAWTGESVVKRLRDRLYHHIQMLPFSWHASTQTGDIIQRSTNDVDVVRRFVSSMMLEFVRTVLMVVVGTVVMFSLNSSLALITLCMVVPVALASLLFSNHISKVTTKQEEAEGALFTVMQENLTAVRVVRAFGRERYELDKFDEANDENRRRLLKLNHTFAGLWSTLDFLCGVENALIMIFGIIYVLNGTLTVGQYTAFSSYVFLFFWPIRGFGRILNESVRTMVAVGRIEEIFNADEEEGLTEGETGPVKGDIVFKDVNFSYDTVPVLKNLNMTIPGGSTVAILGGTGSGKSTLALLLQRLYDPQSGEITVGGKDVRRYQKQHLRSRIGIVLQEPFLYSKTILENIGIKTEHPDPAVAEEAAKLAHVHEDIMDFEDGYDTVVGERGVTLSGGQKQRVAIARALVGESDVLIFDDSLSAVDTATDAAIRAGLKQKEAGVTTIIISHRITTLMEADKIFVMKDGAVVEEGSHEELLRLGGIYRRTYDIQASVEGGEAV